MEHIKLKNSLDSKLQFGCMCSVRILDIFEVITNFSKIVKCSTLLRIQVKRLFYRKMNEQNWEETCHVPWLAIFTKIIEHKLSKLPTTDYIIFRRDRLLARFITPTQIVDELQRLAQLSTYQKPSYALVIEGRGWQRNRFYGFCSILF